MNTFHLITNIRRRIVPPTPTSMKVEALPSLMKVYLHKGFTGTLKLVQQEGRAIINTSGCKNYFVSLFL